MSSNPAVPGGKSRQMIYPYSFTAKLVQFPYKYYFSNGWAMKYYWISVGLCLPLFYKISKISNSPENKAKWKKIRSEWYDGPHH